MPMTPFSAPSPPTATHAPRATASPADSTIADAAVYQQLLDRRIVFLGSEIDDEVARRVNAQLLLLAARDADRDITLYINSPGGAVDAGMAIYDMMRFVPNQIATVGLGLAASMGQALLCAGTPGKRFALRHTRVMMHQPTGGLGGTASDIRIQAEQAVYLKGVLAERFAAHTGQPLERIHADFDRDRWFTAEQAREYGLVDHVVDSTDHVGT